MFLLLCAATWIRFFGIDAKSLWYDEAVSAASLDFGFIECVLRKGDAASVHPPLYFLLLHVWAQIFSDSVWSLRSLAGVCGVATILGMYKFARELSLFAGYLNHADRVGLCVAALTALHPQHIVSSQQVRGYTLGTAFLAWSSWALIQAVQFEGRRVMRYWITWAVLSLLLCYTSNVGFLSVVGQIVFASVWLASHSLPWFASRADSRKLPIPGSSGEEIATSRGGGRVLPACLAIGFVVLGYGLPWSSRLMSQAQTVRRTTAIVRPLTVSSVAQEIHRSFDHSWAADKSRHQVETWLTTSVLTVILLVLVAQRGWAESYLLLTGFLPLILLILFSVFSNRSIVVARYLIFAQLMWMTATAYLVFRSPASWQQFVFGGIVLVSLVLGVYVNWDSFGGWHQPGMRGAVDYVLRQRKGGDEPLVALERHTFFGLKYYARRHASPVLLTDITDRQLLRGGYEMADHDLLTPNTLLAKQLTGIWIFTTDEYSTPQRADFTIPAHWKLVDYAVFVQDYFWERPIEVRYFQIQSQILPDIAATPGD